MADATRRKFGPPRTLTMTAPKCEVLGCDSPWVFVENGKLKDGVRPAPKNRRCWAHRVK